MTKEEQHDYAPVEGRMISIVNPSDEDLDPNVQGALAWWMLKAAEETGQTFQVTKCPKGKWRLFSNKKLSSTEDDHETVVNQLRELSGHSCSDDGCVPGVNRITCHFCGKVVG